MPYTDFHYTPTGTGVISGKEVLEQTEDAINDLGGQISGDVQTAIDTANNALNVANTASSDAQNAVNTANTAYTTATNAQNTANAAQNTASNALTAAQNAQNDVNALGNRVTTAEGNITQNTTNITNLTTRMGTAEGNITTLQNDVVTAQGTATSAQNTATMARQQSYVFRYSGTAVVPNSTIAYSTIDNTDNIKSGDKILDVDGKLFEITAVDTTNQTVTVGSALIDLALDANVMHLTGDETSTGKKTFSDLTTFNSYLYFTNSLVTKGTIPQTSVTPYRIYFGSGVNYGASLFNIDTSVSNTGVQSFIFRAAANVVGGDDARFALTYDPNRSQPRYLSLKGDIEPNANNTYDCGSGTNIWKDLYGYHGYFCGQQKGDEFSSNARTDLTLLANRDTLGKSGALITRFRSNKAQGSMGTSDSQMLGVDFLENKVRTSNVLLIQGSMWVDDVPTSINIVSGVSNNSFGSTSNPCKINNLNPGALSLPDLSSGLDISGYITNLGIGAINEYTPLADGWISIAISGDTPIFIRVYNDYGFEQVVYSERNEVGGTTGGTYTRFGSLIIPCIKNVKIYIIVSPNSSVLVSAKFFPCLGNV